MIPENGANCILCGEHRAKSEFYVRKVSTGNQYNTCKHCANRNNAQRNASRQGRVAQHRQPGGDTKRCTKCGEVKPLNQFPLARRDSERRRAHCADCSREEAQSYRAANAERKRQSDIAYREANRELIAERHRQWRAAHPERLAEISAATKRRHKDAVNAATHRRRSTLAGVGSFTAAEWAALKALYEHRCLMCGRREPEIKLTVDHVQPVSRGGNNTIDNIQPLCKSCNSKKHRKTLDLRGAG